jgi:hypothetical protein
MMIKYVLILIFFFFSCLAQAQAKELSNDYSHVSVTITGYACSVISKGIIEDNERNRWYLPDEVIIPSRKGICTSKSSQSREKSSMTVIALAEKPGAIEAKAGTINIITSPTAGWLAVTNKVAAIVGVSMDEQCQQALNTYKQYKLYTNMGLQDLITVYDKDGIIVYIDEKSILEMVNNPYSKGNFNGNFGATLIFVLKDKKIRLSTIEEIKKNVSIRESFNCQRAVHTPQGTTYTRGLSCAEVEGTAAGKIDTLKYIMIQGAYYQTGISGVVTAGGFIPGPIFKVNRYLYLAPLRCAAIKEGYRYKDLRKEDCESIIGTDENNPTLIYKKLLAFNITKDPQWMLFFGELHPLATATFDILKMGTDQTPLLNQVIKNIQDLIIAKQGK